MQTNVVMGLGNSGELRPSAKNRGGPCALPFARVCCHQFAIKNGVFFVSHHAFSCSVNWVKKTPETIGLATVSGLGGGWWIRTTEGEASRFTVCPLWPLGKSPILNSARVELVDGLEPPTC